ncbi:MAG: hypothetical protein WC824_12130 [Bacteroidota bacterium]
MLVNAKEAREVALGRLREKSAKELVDFENAIEDALVKGKFETVVSTNGPITVETAGKLGDLEYTVEECHDQGDDSYCYTIKW